MSSAVVVAALVLHSAVGAAQDASGEAQPLFEQGVAAAAVGNWAAAILAFERSHALLPHPGTLKNLAMYLEEAGRLAEARRRWSELLSRFGEVVSEATRAEAAGRILELDALVARVSVTADVGGAMLLVDGREVGELPLAEPLVLEPGPHVFEARLAGHAPARAALALVEGEEARVDLTLEPEELSPAVLRVESAAPGATVALDGGEPRAAPFESEVSPGGHEIVVEAPGYVGRARRVEIAVGARVVVSVDLEPEAPPPVDEDGRFWAGPWPWVIGGALLLGGGAATAVILWPADEPESRWTVRVR
ncbi:MAG: PEGA domain-containing protein [Myxococcota bacterium]|nr:PEGA domain-containing protein [Myxococcota bacterium]